MKKYLIVVLGGLISSSVLAATSVCPSVDQIHYSGGGYSVPAGWSVLMTPSCSDNTPTKWIETSWGGLRVNPQRTQCVYEVKGYVPNSGCGALSIVRNQTSADPWYMKGRSANWIDQGSHQQYPGKAWSFCQDDAGGTRESCSFPV